MVGNKDNKAELTWVKERMDTNLELCSSF